jgi:hypothetical protein
VSTQLVLRWEPGVFSYDTLNSQPGDFEPKLKPVEFLGTAALILASVPGFYPDQTLNHVLEHCLYARGTGRLPIMEVSGTRA